MKTELRQYKDVAGNPCSLDWLVRNEPEWAANQIRHRDKLDAENKTLKEALDAIANMPEYDQDDAHRLRNIARRAAESANSVVNANSVDVLTPESARKDKFPR